MNNLIHLEQKSQKNTKSISWRSPAHQRRPYGPALLPARRLSPHYTPSRDCLGLNFGPSVQSRPNKTDRNRHNAHSWTTICTLETAKPPLSPWIPTLLEENLGLGLGPPEASPGSVGYDYLFLLRL